MYVTQEETYLMCLSVHVSLCLSVRACLCVFRYFQSDHFQTAGCGPDLQHYIVVVISTAMSIIQIH